MLKFLFARPPLDADEEREIRKLAGARHAPGDWIVRAQMIISSWQGLRTSAIAAKPGCHMQTVRERLDRFNIEGLAGWVTGPEWAASRGSPRSNADRSSHWRVRPRPASRSAMRAGTWWQPMRLPRPSGH